MDGKSRRLFVYGLLLSGEESHGLLGGAPCQGRTATAPVHALVDRGAYPALTTGHTSVWGEVYEVPDAAFAALDAYEGCPDLYERRVIRLADGSEAEAYVLPGQTAESFPVIAGGDWRRRHG